MHRNANIKTRRIFYKITLLLLLFLSKPSSGSMNCKVNGFANPPDLSAAAEVHACNSTEDYARRIKYIAIQQSIPETGFISGAIFCEAKYLRPGHYNSFIWQDGALYGNHFECRPDEHFVDLSDLDQDAQNEGEAAACTANPINLISGNKYKIHTDINHSDTNQNTFKPEFTRVYNSLSYSSTDNAIGLNWRHNYQRSLKIITPLNPATHINSLSQSSIYSSLQTACTEGFNEVTANQAEDGSSLSALKHVLGGTAVWTGKDCIVRDANNKYITTIPLLFPQNTTTNNTILSYKIRALRSDGKEVLFKKIVAELYGAPTWELQSSKLQYKLEQFSNDIEQPDGNSLRVITYALTDENNIKETYDSFGKLLTVEYINGVIETLTYENNLLARVENNSGQFIEFTHYPDNTISSVTDESDRTWSYTYTAGLLTKVTNPDNTEKNYHYEDVNTGTALTGLTDERGIRYSTFEYYADGLAKSSFLGEPNAIPEFRINDISLTYGATSNTATDSRGNSSTYHFSTDVFKDLLTQFDGPECDGCIGGSSIFDYEIDSDSPENSTLNLLSKTEYGLQTTFENYDDNHNPQTITEAANVPAEARTKTYTYTDLRHPNKVATITEASVLPDNDKVTTYTYDDAGNTTSETIEGFQPDGTAVSRITSYTFGDPLYQLTEIDGPRLDTDIDDITTITYYANDVAEGNNRAKMKSVTTPLDLLVADNIQWTATGKKQSYDSLNNLQVAFTYYPGNDRLENITQTDTTSSQSQTTRLTYLATGETKTITTAYGTSDATIITLQYDDARRLTDIVDGLGNYIHYILDTEGNITDEEIYDSGDNLTKALNQTFDAYNRLDVLSQANEESDPTFAPDGTLDTSVDGNNVTTDYGYDALRRLTQINQDEGGSDPTTANATTDITYDSQDNLTSVTDPINGTTIYVYDDLGNLLSQTSPDTDTTTYGHDAAGNITSSLDAKGQLTSYSYDALNRLTSTDAPGTADDFTYSYDNCSNGAGLLCSVTSASSSITYAYDAFGNTTAHQAVAYSYDDANRTHTVTYPSGAVITYSYDAAGQISKVELTRNGSTVTLANNIIYAPFGDINSLTYGNTLSLTQSFDLAYRITSQNIPAMHNLLYSQYDANGNLEQRDDVISSITDTFLFDALDRLDIANGTFGARNYDYDKNGNRTQLDDGAITSYGYEANSNRMNQNGANIVLLDDNGNTTNDGNRSYTHNTQNRILEVFDSGVLKATYTYNGLGQRISKHFPDGGGRHYVYGLDGLLLAETDLNSIVLKEYIYLNGKLLALYHADSDSDGSSNVDEDIDGTNPTSFDSDGDGISDYNEIYVYGTSHILDDTDGDGIDDRLEINLGSDPLNLNISLGDINLNAEINLGDYLLLTQFVLGTSTANPTEHAQADLNNDGQLNIQDMLIMQRALLGMGIASVDDFDLMNMFASIWDGLISNAYAALGDGEIYYVHNDHLGTPKAMTNEFGIKVWGATHDPFGLATVDVGSSVEFNVRFPGQYYDGESGLHYNYFRYYDPNIGRYITSDPIGLLGGINTYSYVENNPVNYIDPYGLWLVPAARAIAAVATAASGYVFFNNAGNRMDNQSERNDQLIDLVKDPRNSDVDVDKLKKDRFEDARDTASDGNDFLDIIDKRKLLKDALRCVQ